jgi:hypothetical protein
LLTAGAALLAAAADLSGSGCMLMPSSLLLCSLPCLPFFLQTKLQLHVRGLTALQGHKEANWAAAGQSAPTWPQQLQRPLLQLRLQDDTGVVRRDQSMGHKHCMLHVAAAVPASTDTSLAIWVNSYRYGTAVLRLSLSTTHVGTCSSRSFYAIRRVSGKHTCCVSAAKSSGSISSS